MGKVLAWVIAICFLSVIVPPAQASLFGKKDKSDTAAAASPQAPKASPAPKMDKATLESLNAKRAAADKKKTALNNTEWQLDMTPMSGKGNKETETLVFASDQVSFPGYAKHGFSKTNYTLTMQDNGSAVWETMQTSEKSGTTFWRGELDPEMQSMRGILSYQQADGVNKDYSFVSTSKKAIAPAEEKEVKPGAKEGK